MREQPCVQNVVLKLGYKAPLTYFSFSIDSLCMQAKANLEGGRSSTSGSLFLCHSSKYIKNRKRLVSKGPSKQSPKLEHLALQLCDAFSQKPRPPPSPSF